MLLSILIVLYTFRYISVTILIFEHFVVILISSLYLYCSL